MAALSSIERILGDLVAIDSVSARSNVEIARYLRTTLEHLGCAVTELRYRDDLGIVKVNLVAILGPSREVLGGGGLALSIHVDTPAWAPEWRDALTLRRNEGRLHGRGVCSGKGFAAAAIAAVSTVDVPNLERPVALVFTADGEMGGLGARRLTENHTVEPLAVIVAEPTSNRPARATKGSFVAEIDIEGREVNSAYPDLGASAIRRATEVLEGLKRIEAEVREDKDPTFDPPYSTLNVGMLQAGRAANLVPGHCRLVVEWRPTSIEAAARIRSRIEEEVRRVATTDGSLPIRVTVTRTDLPVAASADLEIVRFFSMKTGIEAGAVPFATELGFWLASGADGIIFGPGDVRDIRHDGESVAEHELRRASDLLGRAMEHWCVLR